MKWAKKSLASMLNESMTQNIKENLRKYENKFQMRVIIKIPNNKKFTK